MAYLVGIRHAALQLYLNCQGSLAGDRFFGTFCNNLLEWNRCSIQLAPAKKPICNWKLLILCADSGTLSHVSTVAPPWRSYSGPCMWWKHGHGWQSAGIPSFLDTAQRSINMGSAPSSLSKSVEVARIWTDHDKNCLHRTWFNRSLPGEILWEPAIMSWTVRFRFGNHQVGCSRYRQARDITDSKLIKITRSERSISGKPSATLKARL